MEEAPPWKQFPKDHSHQLEEDLTCHLIHQHLDEIASYSTSTQENIAGLQSSTFQDSQDPHAFLAVSKILKTYMEKLDHYQLIH